MRLATLILTALFFVIALALPAHGQPTPVCKTLQVRVVAEPPDTLLDIIPKAHRMSYFEIDAKTNDPTGCTIGFPDLALAVSAAGGPDLLSPASANLNLQQSAQKSGWAKAGKIVLTTIAFAGPGIGIAGLVGTISKTAGLIGATAGGAITQYGPQFYTVIEGQVPNPAGLLPSLQYPITLQPGVWVTDYEFTARVNVKAAAKAAAKRLHSNTLWGNHDSAWFIPKQHPGSRGIEYFLTNARISRSGGQG